MPASASPGPRAETSEGGRVLSFYQELLRVRRCEERLLGLFADAEVPGFIHLSIGQEAVPVGVTSALRHSDTVASTHRGHGHAIAKGIPLEGFFAELLGKASGLCRGRGGSMHVADLGAGMLGANGIVGAGLSIAVGSALAHRRGGEGRIAVAYFGDGALAEGLLHESANLAALWKLPVLFVCEANGWSEFSPAASQIAFDLRAWCDAFGIGHERVDGSDVLAVAAAAERAVRALRAGGGPELLECATTRVRGHFEGDAQKYRPEDEATGPDPLDVALAHLERLGVDAASIAETQTRVEAQIETALAAARAGAAPSPRDALADVYTEVPG